jgi:succinate dehydrogenase / fumarate reductase cytochrome b subunit
LARLRRVRAAILCRRALFFHLSHGIRHLLWEAGWGYEIPQAYGSAKVALGATAVLTLVTWAAALA